MSKVFVFMLGIFLGFIFFNNIILINAYEADIHVRTLEYHDVVVNIMDPTQDYSMIDNFKKLSGKNGEFNLTYETDMTEIGLNILVKKNGRRVMYEKLGKFSVFESIYVQVKPGEISTDYTKLEGYVPTEDETIINNSDLEINKTDNINSSDSLINSSEDFNQKIINENKSLINAMNTKSNEDLKVGDFLKNNIYYILISVFILGLLIFFIMNKNKTKNLKSKSELSGRDLNKSLKQDQMNLRSGSNENPDILEEESEILDAEKRIAQAEKEIKEAQLDIKKVRDKEKIKLMEKKLEEDRKELDRLRSSE